MESLLKMNSLNKFIFCIGVIFCFSAAILAISVIIYEAQVGFSEYRTDLPCYDRAGNVINGVLCSGSITTDAGLISIKRISNFFIAFMSTVMIGLLLICYASNRDSDEYLEDLKKRHNDYIKEMNERRQKEKNK